MSSNQSLGKTGKVGLIHGADLQVGSQGMERDQVGFHLAPNGGYPIFRCNRQVLVEGNVFLAAALMKGKSCYQRAGYERRCA